MGVFIIFIFILFFTWTSGAVIPYHENDFVIVSDNLRYFNRDKRDVAIRKNDDDNYSIKFNKDLIHENDNTLSVFGMLEDLKRNEYDTIKTGLDFKNSNGNGLDLSALNSKKETKISGQGLFNILKTDTNSLVGKVFGEKSFINADPLYKYGGILDYTDKKGDSLSLAALNSNKDKEYSASGHLNLLRAGSQSLDVNAYGEKTLKSDNGNSKVGGSLDYINKNGDNLHLTARQNSNLGKEFKAKGTYIILDKPNYSLNAEGYWDKNIPKVYSPVESYGASLNYINDNGDRASLLAKHSPDLGDKLEVNGKYNIYQNNDHDLDLTGKLSRVFPSGSSVGGYNTYSANLDYLYKDKVTANLGVERSGLLDRTDVSALGKLHILNDKNTHFDIFGGVSRSMSPKFDTGFQPNFGLELETDF